MTASVPIVRYYDHLRYMYEVESRMRELRRTTEGDNQGNDNNSTPQNNATPNQPGESKQTPPHKDGGSRMDLPQQSGKPEVLTGCLTTQAISLKLPLRFKGLTAHSGSSKTARRI